MKVINFAARQTLAIGPGWTLHRSHHTDFNGSAAAGGFTLGRFGLLVRYPNGSSKWLLSSVRFDGLRLSSFVFKVHTGFELVEIGSCDLPCICARIEKLFADERARAELSNAQYWARRRAIRTQSASAEQLNLFDSEDLKVRATA